MKIPINLKDRPLSYSSLKEFRKSPKHYVKYITSDRKPPSPEMILGNAFELRLYSFAADDLKLYQDGIHIYTKPNLRSNAGKEEWEAIKTAGEGKIMIDEEQAKTVEAMLLSMQEYPEMVEYVKSIRKTQVKLSWTDRKTGMPFIGYVDAEANAFDSDWVFDIKVTKDADPDAFQRAAFNWDYQQQIATYAEGYHKTQFRFPNFAFLCFDYNEPFNCSVIFVESKVLEEAREEWRRTVQAFKFCMDEELFHQGYEFRLQSMPYFSLRKPGYYKPKF
jgi:hypothetical protein